MTASDNGTSDEEGMFLNMVEKVRGTTQVVYTPEMDATYQQGSAWLYSVGMKDNYDIPDIQMRGVPMSFIDTAGTVLNEMNAYRLLNPDKPFLVGQRVSWSCGDFVIHESEAWEGAYSWNAEDMLTLLPPEIEVNNCICCSFESAGCEP